MTRQIIKSVTRLEHRGGAIYSQAADDPEARGHVFTLDEGVFALMGQPEVINVTIEPGDQVVLEATS